MDTLDVLAKLDTVQCLDAGESRAEPYLWTVFFKIDGSTCRVSRGVLVGKATVVGTSGISHENLPSTRTGDFVAIPPKLGEFRTRLVPIPFDERLDGQSEVGGTFGIAVVLMEQDNTSEHDVNAGRMRLTTAVQEQLDALIPKLNAFHQEPTEAEIQTMRQAIGAAVRGAISAEVSAGEWFLAGGDMDDEIGAAFFRFSQSSLTNAQAGPVSVPFEQTWNNEGKWKIRGRVVCHRPAPVMIFADSDYSGAGQVLPAGRYNVGQLTIGNDRLSSVRVPRGWQVTLFAEAGFFGDSVVLTSDTPTVPAILNNRTSSIVVEGPFVTIYADRGLQGASQMLRAGAFDTAQLSIGNDRLSSIAVPEGWEVTLFQHAGFTGQSKVVKANTGYVGDEMENQTSSIRVRPVLTPPIHPSDPIAVG